MTVYLDYNATAPARPEAIARMQELLALPMNASSVHAFGREAKKHLEDARKVIAEAISAWPNEIIFTASGTEANLTALRGTGRRVIVSAIEHSSVIRHSGESRNPAATKDVDPGLRRDDVIPVDSNGVVDLSALEKMLAGGPPALVSVMLANNETGVIQPVAEVAAICRAYGALLHCDAVQGLGKIPVDFGALGADMMTLAGHKCGGPVGAAALVVRRELPLQPLLTGGGQELNRRAGTENIAAIVGFARAVELIDLSHMQKVRGWLDGMEREISSPLQAEGVIIGSAVSRLPNTSCIAMPGVSNEVQLMDFDLKGFAVSAGSACSSGRIEPSHVLRAMGVDKKLAGSAIRVSAGWKTTQKEIGDFAHAWQALYQRLHSRAGGM